MGLLLPRCAGHRNIVRSETVTIMRKMVDGSYNLHITGYSYAKTTSELQVFRDLEEAYAWMELIESSLGSTPLPPGARPVAHTTDAHGRLAPRTCPPRPRLPCCPLHAFHTRTRTRTWHMAHPPPALSSLSSLHERSLTWRSRLPAPRGTRRDA